jgi:hypothetical protein
MQVEDMKLLAAAAPEGVAEGGYGLSRGDGRGLGRCRSEKASKSGDEGCDGVRCSAHGSYSSGGVTGK